MLTEFLKYIQGQTKPNQFEIDGLTYFDRELHLIKNPSPSEVTCSTLQGLVDFFEASADSLNEESESFVVQIVNPFEVAFINIMTDEFARRRVLIRAKYPECRSFNFGTWMDPESFIIAAQQGFQRVKIENDDGSFKRDLDYVLQIASKISAEAVTKHEDDGFTQRVAVTKGISLKEETILKPMVSLAPYRTFAEIDQPVSDFVFRAKTTPNNNIQLALFEGDGGRWKIGAAAAIKAWLSDRVDVNIIS